MNEKSTRGQIVDAADSLFYQRGYEHTSFTDIADVVRISRGNFYHHFKTKDEILDAVIEARLDRTALMLERWEADDNEPADRIRSFIQMMVTNRADIKRYGCPVGTLCAELAKLNHSSKDEANRLFELFRGWLGKQFADLGHGTQADTLAMHLLGRSQGVASLANAFNDEAFIKHEAKQMCIWLEAYVSPALKGGTRKAAAKPMRRSVGV